MEWRVTIELSGADGTKQTHEVARGGADPHSTFDPLGLTLDDGKALLAGVQRQSGSGPDLRVLRAAAPLLALPGPPPAEGYAQTAVEFAVRYGRSAGAAFHALSMRGYCQVDTLPGIGTHARPLHFGVRADIGEDGSMVAISLRPAVPIRVLPARR